MQAASKAMDEQLSRTAILESAPPAYSANNFQRDVGGQHLRSFGAGTFVPSWILHLELVFMGKAGYFPLLPITSILCILSPRSLELQCLSMNSHQGYETRYAAAFSKMLQSTVQMVCRVKKMKDH